MLGLLTGVPTRQQRLAGRYARAKGVPFEMPVRIDRASAALAAFPVNADRAADLLPGDAALHPFRAFGNTGLLLVTATDYEATSFGAYVELGLMIVCTRGARPAPPLVSLLRPRHYGVGLYVVDLPVSTERSARAGRDIWGLPKRRADLDVRVGEDVVSGRYGKDGQLACRIDIGRPSSAPVNVPFYVEVPAYSRFRGMLVRSRLYVRARAGVAAFGGASARLALGEHPRVQPLEALEVAHLYGLRAAGRRRARRPHREVVRDARRAARSIGPQRIAGSLGFTRPRT